MLLVMTLSGLLSSHDIQSLALLTDLRTFDTLNRSYVGGFDDLVLTRHKQWVDLVWQAWKLR